MKWYSKSPPLYVFPYDTWERETDHKIFIQKMGGWVSDGELIEYPKKCKMIGFDEPERFIVNN